MYNNTYKIGAVIYYVWKWEISDQNEVENRKILCINESELRYTYIIYI